MWRRITSPAGARTRRVFPAVMALLMALMILTLACEEGQALGASGGAVGVGGGGGIASPEAQLLQRSLELTGELQSFRAHVEMLMMKQGQRLPLSFDMIKAANGRMRLVMEMDALASGMRMTRCSPTYRALAGCAWTPLPCQEYWDRRGPVSTIPWDCSMVSFPTVLCRRTCIMSDLGVRKKSMACPPSTL